MGSFLSTNYVKTKDLKGVPNDAMYTRWIVYIGRMRLTLYYAQLRLPDKFMQLKSWLSAIFWDIYLICSVFS